MGDDVRRLPGLPDLQAAPPAGEFSLSQQLFLFTQPWRGAVDTPFAFWSKGESLNLVSKGKLESSRKFYTTIVPGWSLTRNVAEIGLNLLIFLPLPRKCWDYRHAPPPCMSIVCLPCVRQWVLYQGQQMNTASDLQWIKSRAIHSPRCTEWYFQRSRLLIWALDYEWKTKEWQAMQGHNTCKAKGMNVLVSSDSWAPVWLAKRCQD